MVKRYSKGQMVIRKDGIYAPFVVQDKNNRIQTRYAKIHPKSLTIGSIEYAKLKRLHELNKIYDRHNKSWKQKIELKNEPENEQPENEQPENEQPENEQTENEQNVNLTISIGDYEHTEFDIILKRVFSKEEYQNLIERSSSVEIAHERMRKETIDMAILQLRKNKHFGLAKMLKNNDNIDYVEGGEYTWTNEQPQEAEFIRFDIRGQNKLKEISTKRKIQKKIIEKEKGYSKN